VFFKYLGMVSVRRRGKPNGVGGDTLAQSQTHGLATEDSRMRFSLTAASVLALTLTLVHVGISQTNSTRLVAIDARSPSSISQSVATVHRMPDDFQPGLTNFAIRPLELFGISNTSSPWQRFCETDLSPVVVGLDSLLPGRSGKLAGVSIVFDGAAGSDQLVHSQVARHVLLTATRTPIRLVADSSPAALAEQVRAVRGSFQAVNPTDVAKAQADLKAKVDRLGWLMSGQGANEKAAADAWKSFLHWDDVERAANQPSGIRADDLNNLAEIIRAGQSSETLDPHDDETAANNLSFRTALQDVGDALRQYELLMAASGPNAQSEFDRRIDDLAKSLSANTGAWTSADENRVGQLLGELATEHQASSLVQEVHGQFSQPNLVVHAPAAFVAKLSEQDPVDETNNDFRDNIMGTSIVGTTHIQGQKTVTLIPNNQQGVLGVTFNGTVTSRTVGYHSPVTITAHGTTELHGTVMVTINGDGFTSSQACSHACTHTCIDCIQVCGGWLVRRIAPKKVYKSKPEAECIAAQHAEQRLNERITSDSTESLGKSNRNYKAKIRDPLMSWGAFPQVSYATTANELTVNAVEANVFQLAAPTAAPPVEGSPFLALRLHQSFVNNLLASSLGGRTISQAQFENGTATMLGPEAAAKTRKSGESPEQIREREAKMTDAQREEYEQKLKFMKANRKITFAEGNPVTVDFAGDGFSITIRGTRFEGEDLDRPAGAENITAHYKLENSPNGPKLARRQGDISVEMPASRTRSPDWRKLTLLERTTVKSAEASKLRGRFKDLLPPTIDFQGLDFSNSATPWNRLGQLQACRVSSGDGWLAIDWKAAE
jgi:hypothetical protein